MSLPQFRTVDELAAEMFPTWEPRKSKRWIYRAIEERGLPAHAFGRQRLVDIREAAEWLDRQRAA